jgi:hypothetical protein
VAPAEFVFFKARLAGSKPSLYEEEFVEDETPDSYFQTLFT